MTEDELRYLVPIDCLNLSVRCRNIMKDEKINYIWQLLIYDRLDLLKIPGLGRKTFNEITEILEMMGLKMGKAAPVGIVGVYNIKRAREYAIQKGWGYEDNNPMKLPRISPRDKLVNKSLEYYNWMKDFSNGVSTRTVTEHFDVSRSRASEILNKLVRIKCAEVTVVRGIRIFKICDGER